MFFKGAQGLPKSIPIKWCVGISEQNQLADKYRHYENRLLAKRVHPEFVFLAPVFCISIKISKLLTVD